MHTTEQAFAAFDRHHGAFTPTWNWASFALGPFWYLARGLWAKAALYTLVALVSLSIDGPMILLVMAAFGLLGHYDLYLLQRRNTPLWDVGANPLVSPAGRTSSRANFEVRLRILTESYQQGLLDPAEYDAKRSRLLREMEHEDKLRQLDKALAAGVLTQAEYDAKASRFLVA